MLGKKGWKANIAKVCFAVALPPSMLPSIFLTQLTMQLFFDTTDTASTVSVQLMLLLIRDASVATTYTACIFCTAFIREETLCAIIIFHIAHAYSMEAGAMVDRE
eukprot:5362982-Ditylum_brightwellii.AAC.1